MAHTDLNGDVLMVNVYENIDGVETLVFREMNDEEYDAWLIGTKEPGAHRADDAPHPLLEQIASLSDEDKAELKKLLGV
jgi:hypothetical protein